MTDGEVRALARQVARDASRETLLEVLSGRSKDRLSRFAKVAARHELVNRYACSDCGSAAGQECKLGYGCQDRSRERNAGARLRRTA